MKLTYNITIDDLIAFSHYHYSRSPAVQQAKFTVMIVVSALIIGGSFLIPSNDDFTRPILVCAAIVFAGLFLVIYNYRSFPASLDRQAKRMFEEGANKDLLGEHELDIDEQGLVERTEFSETRLSWLGVERIAETPDHAFIYISSVMAYVIPKHSVVAGDLDTFIIHAKKCWSAANSRRGNTD